MAKMRGKRWVVLGGIVMVAAIIAVFVWRPWGTQSSREFRAKEKLLRESVLNGDVALELGDAPAGDVGHVVFFSVCDGTSRARVFSGTGADLNSAWNAARSETENALKKDALTPRWVKVDVVNSTRRISEGNLSREVLAARHEFYRYGLAFDSNFDTALLEAEMNGAKIYEYDEGGVDFEYLNRYLRRAGRDTLDVLPEQYTLFECYGWFCDETGKVYELIRSGLDYGRREVTPLDGQFAWTLINNASDFLMDQVKEDGSFVYGIYPRFDNDINNYNIVRHASTLWSLICRYRISPAPELAEMIERTIGYMLTQVVYAGTDIAYLYESKDDEIKLGGCGVAVIALTEYMDVFANDQYLDVSRALGNGILSMMDQETGTYWHVLNGDFSRKEELRTVYYDGEATFALARLYGLTGERIWLDAACSAVDHFIAANYEQYKDHWVAYSLNEVTRYVSDRKDYYSFALRNAQENLTEIAERDTTYHTYLELLMATFELYDRMVERGIEVGNFNIDELITTIHIRVNRQLNGYFFPEYAMYMANPQRILNTFMVRHDGYRVRIDDVQHNIGGFYLYWKNYDKLIAYEDGEKENGYVSTR